MYAHAHSVISYFSFAVPDHAGFAQYIETKQATAGEDASYYLCTRGGTPLSRYV